MLDVKQIIIYSLALFLDLLFTYFTLKWWIPRAKKAGLVGKDMNKYSKPEVAEIGGISVVVGILVGILAYLGLRTYIFQKVDEKTIAVLAMLNVFVLAAFMGLVDDLLGRKLGLSQWQKPLLLLLAAIPLSVVNVGVSTVELPILGKINLGLLYPFVIVPIAISGAANAFNILAGYNGLEAGQGLIIFSAYLIHFLHHSQLWLAFISLLIVLSLLVFLKYNWYPAKVFPGNVFTYAIGSMIAALAIVGNCEKFALVLFTPYFLHAILYFRAYLEKGHMVEAFGIPDKNDCLREPEKNCYHLPHCAIKLLRKLKGCTREKDVVLTILTFQAIFALIALALYG